MECYFEKCIVIGSGQFAFKCAKYLKEEFQLDCVYEYGSYMQSRLGDLCKKDNMPYVKLCDKTDCNDLMASVITSKKKTLIISASNIYIFPAYVTECSDVKIINYHPALLSHHLGRNAEAWAIYGQDEVTGVTWHEVTSEIDHGLILAEEIIELDNNINSIKLMIKQYQIGFLLFKKIIGKIIENKNIQKCTVQKYGNMHFSYEKPNDGVLDLSWNIEKISSFLRSMDYGNLNIMGRPYFVEKNIKYVWDSFEILENERQLTENDKAIKKENLICILRNVRQENSI